MNVILFSLEIISILASHHDPDVSLETYDDNWMGRVPIFAFSKASNQPTLKQDVEKKLEVGDKIDVWGEYRTGTGKFNVNLVAGSNKMPLHIDFRPWGGTVVLNSLKSGVGWQQEIVCPIPSFINEQKFEVSILCTDDGYSIKVDGIDLCEKFPYRIPLSKITQVMLNDEYQKYISWIKINMPIPAKFTAAIAHLENEIRKGIGEGTFKIIKDYAASDINSIHIYQWNCLKKKAKQGSSINLKDEHIWWVFNNLDAMEQLMTSGDIEGNRYKEAI